MSSLCLLVHIEGRVQKVGFRWWLTRLARARGLAGWVRNRADGSVEALLCGQSEDVEAVLCACREGPASADVWRVSASPAVPPVAPGFAPR